MKILASVLLGIGFLFSATCFADSTALTTHAQAMVTAQPKGNAPTVPPAFVILYAGYQNGGGINAQMWTGNGNCSGYSFVTVKQTASCPAGTHGPYVIAMTVGGSEFLPYTIGGNSCYPIGTGWLNSWNGYYFMAFPSGANFYWAIVCGSSSAIVGTGAPTVCTSQYNC